MLTLKKLLARRAEIIEDLKSILDTADAEERAISDEEETRYNELETELEGVEADIVKREAEDERRKKLDQRVASLERPRNNPPPLWGNRRAQDPD